MKIAESQIKTKALAGHTASGDPVAYILTKGGLHAFFINGQSGVEALAAAPHIAIARHFAEKKSPGIKWEADYILKSEMGHEQMKKYFFLDADLAKSEKTAEIADDVVMVYRLKPKTFEIMTKTELSEALAKGDFEGTDLVRPMNLSKKEDFLEDGEYAQVFKQRNIVYPD